MADVQIAIIDQQNTQIALAAPSETEVTVAVPGVQGPVGEGVPAGGTANQVLFKQSGTDYDTAWSNVTSDMIGDLEIVDADVAASAAIAGIKISPNFGSQNVVTTGTSTAASFIPTSSTAPTNGVYLPSANNVAISTNGTGRLFIDASGNINIDSGGVYYDAVNNRLAVGTTTPSAVLHTVATSAGAATVGAFLQNSDTTTGTEVRLAFGPATNSVSDNRYGWIGCVNTGGTNGTAFIFATGPGGTPATERARIDSSGRLLVGMSSQSGGALLQVNGDRIRVATAKTPASATDTGTTGEICWDANYVYVCTATNTWKRSALSTW